VTHDALDDEQRTEEQLAAQDQLSDGEAADVAEIEAEIEETRLEMGGTLNELGDRLDPGNLVNQAKDNVRDATIGRVEDTAKGVSTMVMDTIKRNPIPAALAGAGLAMLWANRSKGDEYAYPYRQQRSVPGGGPDLGARISDAASTVGGNVTGTVGSVAEGAQQVTGEAFDRGRQTAVEVGGQLERFMQANPLAMGAIALGAGAVVGSVLPETPQEREMLGDASRQVGSVVKETVDKATTKADETLDRAEEKVVSST
jgi:hypothetical protein